MSVDIRKPVINADTEEGQISQIRSYLIQLTEQLNWALNLQGDNDGVVLQGGTNKTTAQKEAEAKNTFEAVKALIVKSADVVNELYEGMERRMRGEYLAISDFGTYRNSTEAALLESSTYINQLYSSEQEIESAVDGVQSALLAVTANIKTGLLYEQADGTPVYGLEIGQRSGDTFRKYARFTSDRLSFYDQNDTEIAYISDYKMFITSAQVTGNLKIGGYTLDTSNGLAFRWEG